MQRLMMALTLISGVLASPHVLRAGDDLALMFPAEPNLGWRFDNGREFAGATGSLSVDPTGGHEGGAALVLKGDFTKGGQYVEAGLKVDGPVPGMVSLWVKVPEEPQLTVRLMDEAGTCHQIKFKLKPTPDWQQIRFPLAEFFANMGESRASAMVSHYEHWGQSKTSEWQGSLKGIHILAGKSAGQSRTVCLGDVSVKGRVATVESAPARNMLQTVRLDEVLQAGESDWLFDNGREFKGAKGSLTLLKDQPEAGQNALRLKGDFTGGGAYVQALRKLSELSHSGLESLEMAMRSTNCSMLGVRLIDSSGQCHQFKGLAIVADGQWHDVKIKPAEIAGGEHWGGANDGKWHGAPKSVALILAKRAGVEPVVDFAKPRALVAMASQTATVLYREDFEHAPLAKGWESVGEVKRLDGEAFKGKGALQLSRSLESINQPVTADGPSFQVLAGTCEVSGAGQSAVYSPDESYQGVISVAWLDGSGKSTARSVVQELRGTNVWLPFNRSVEVPAGAVAGRIHVEFAKTYGVVMVDELSVVSVPVPQGAVARIDRVMLSPSRLGGMFFPDESPSYKVSVWSPKPLQQDEMRVVVSVSDFWGAELDSRQTVSLQKTGFKNQSFQYEGGLTLATNGMEVGRFYRVHADVPLRGGKPFRHSIGLARLPEAATRQYAPESIPFTIRNWDNRMKDYFFLTDRIGIRMPGIWGGWSKTAPYKPTASGAVWCQQLGMKWVSGLPGSKVELGKIEWADPVLLRTGMTNFLRAHATNGLAYLCLGNEPHGGASQIASNIAAYKVLYDAAKEYDPNIRVIATSVEPNEEYFRQGYQKYCDIYDFHTYESYLGIRRIIEAYKALMLKYHAEKPIFSTELGLNCQGLSRLIVAQEMVKKFAVFFAAGGANASWFTIMYPDPSGKDANSSGQAFNVFDARYNQYNPKLDAVTLYQAVNAIADKKFVAEQAYGDGTEAYLFANPKGECLQIVWNEKTRRDIGLPVPGALAATVVTLDGSAMSLVPHNGSVAVTVSAEPVMVVYHSPKPALAEALVSPVVSLASAPESVVKGQQRELLLCGAGLTPQEIHIVAPSRWQVTCREAGKDRVACRVSPPAETEAQAGRLMISRLINGAASSALLAEMPVESSFSGTLRPAAGVAGGAGLQVMLANHNQEALSLHWKVSLDHELPMAKGSYRLTDPQPAHAGFGEAAEGETPIAPGSVKSFCIPLKGTEPLTLYKVSLRVGDDSGHETTTSRYVGGFLPVRKGTPTVDGDLTDPVWAGAPVAVIDQPRQFYGLKGAEWKGAEDLSARIRYLWDEKNLYLGVQVVDNVFSSTQADSGIWNQDGLQILVDPRRQGGEKMGYYDCCLALGTKGPQVWYNSTASPDVMTGEVKDARLVVRRGKGGSADYEVAIPWTRLAPFRPVAGADLGLGLIVNDDDGSGRSFAGWFSGVHLKETDMLGDLILGD